MNVLIVVDMQNDFINGSLGTDEAVAILPAVREKIKGFHGEVLFTRDTHFEDYLSTAEGKKLPVLHCVKNTDGWKIEESLEKLRTTEPFDKLTFGSVELSQYLLKKNNSEGIDSIELVGLCTDICVISNAMMIKAFLPEVEISVDSKCCAGVTPQSHENALSAMESCQIDIKR